ncbi:MAG: DUF4238 domain-containing protein [Alphaproteobacteria bacterium]|jgi:hypothetical protein|nr:DUF4238 domain-containing protein [Alphaproteobacteria bacterium]
MAEARRHHFVPQCYLKGFGLQRDKDCSLACFNLAEAKRFDTSPLNIANKRDFNRIEVEGHSPTALETRIADFEGKLDGVLGAVIETSQIADGYPREILLEFVAHLLCRNPRLRRKYDDFLNDTLNMMLRIQTSSPERFAQSMSDAIEAGALAPDEVPALAEMREWASDPDLRLTYDQTYQIGLELQTYDPALIALRQRGWRLIEALPDAGSFITSDHPVRVDWHRPEDHHPMLPPGLGTKGTYVMMPVSSKLALMGTFDMVESATTLKADRRTVAEINFLTITSADRQVYAGSTDFYFRSWFTGEVLPGDQLEDALAQASKDRDKRSPGGR